MLTLYWGTGVTIKFDIFQQCNIIPSYSIIKTHILFFTYTASHGKGKGKVYPITVHEVPEGE
jgi:hypothetical protein